MRLLVPILLALAFASPLAAAAEVDARPGVLVPYADGDTLTWRLPPGDDHVVFVRAGNQSVRVQWLSPTRPAAETMPVPTPQGGGTLAEPGTLTPNAGFGSRVVLAEGQALSLAFSGGPGWALVSNWSMAEEGSSGNGTVATLRDEGRLAPGECVAQSFSESSLGNVRQGKGVLRGRAVVEAGGPGVRFRLYDAEARVLGEGTDAMGVWLPQETLEAFAAHTMHLQACAPEDASEPLRYVLRVTRFSTGEPTEAAARSGRIEVPLGPLLPPAALLLAALARRHGLR